MDLPERVESALLRHPAIASAQLTGSRARGEETGLSDWDFAVETDDFDSVSAALPELIAPLGPISQLWDPLGEPEHSCYMFFLRGPVKVDFIFDRAHPPEPPWEPRADTLAAIDAHFWDWSWWIASKQAGGRDRLVAAELAKLSDYLLRPMGAAAVEHVKEAVRGYVAARSEQERRLGVDVDRRLGEEVLGGLRRAGYDI